MKNFSKGGSPLTKTNTAKSAGMVMILTICARLAAMVSQSVYMARIGMYDTYLNIYAYVLNLPNVVFTIYGTALGTVVIPIFGSLLSTGKKKKAYDFANNIFTFSTIITIILVIIGFFAAPFISSFSEYSKTTEGKDFLIKGLRILFPVMIFYAWNYILQGILQSNGKFAMPAIVSLPSALIIIIYVLTLYDTFGMTGLLVATLIGLSMQALILIPPIYKSTDYRIKLALDFKNQDLKKSLKLMVPVMFSSAAAQVNMLFNMTYISYFGEYNVSMNYAQQIVVQSILAFVFSVTAVVYPKLTAFAAQKDMDGFNRELRSIKRILCFTLIPISLGFIALSTDLVNFLAGYGKVDQDQIKLTANMISMYAICIFALGIKEVMDRAFYAVKNTRIPAINGVIIMILNIIGSLLLTRFLGFTEINPVLGIPLAYSVSIIAGFIILSVIIRKKIGKDADQGFLQMVIKVAVSSALMMLCIYGSSWLLDSLGFTMSGGILIKIVRLGVPFAVGVSVYCITAYLLKIPELVMIVKNVVGKVVKKKKI